ncbi:ParA family protein [Mycoplasma capricolum]|uniref:ParA family protein n=1 Tax=Mycoplasma capricolum TaxID=2095 RepID=UPI003DA1D860
MKKYKKILIHNNKGGVGKTLITSNLAVYLASQDKKVLLIDFDRQRSLTNFFTNSKQEESFKIFNKNETVDIIPTNVKNIWIIPGDSKVEPLLPFMTMDASFRKFENQYFDDFDYIFFDLHSALTNSTTLSYKNADSVIFITDTSLNSASILTEFVEDWHSTLSESGLDNNIKAVILNRFQPTKQPLETLELLKRKVPQYLLKTVIPNQANISKSILPEQKWMFESPTTKQLFIDLVSELKERKAI